MPAHLFKLYLYPVKLLTLVLGIYMLVLPCMPCMDTDECKGSDRNTAALITDHGDHENDKEACAPFCNCTCCGHIVTSNFQALKIAGIRPLPAKRLQCHYNNISLSSDYFGNIWQPPRIG